MPLFLAHGLCDGIVVPQRGRDSRDLNAFLVQTLTAARASAARASAQR